MILEALQLVKEELKQYFEVHDAANNEVVLGNIGMLESEECGNKDKVVISLVNIEEERTLKNGKSFVKDNNLNTVSYQNRPVHLNLYLLFSAYFCAGPMAYEISLQKLSHIIRFFQSKNVFTVQAADVTANLGNIDVPARNNLRLILNIYTMTFEQLNHLWGSLGGKQVPFVMYRAWLVELKDEKLDKAGQLIEQIESKELIY